MSNPEMDPPDVRHAPGIPKANLWTAKKRVLAEVQLADGGLLKGSLYADLLRMDGSAATIADRLNDPSEKYVPLATEERHVLLNKSRIVLIRLDASEIQSPPSQSLLTLPVMVRLASGAVEKGELRAVLPPARSRLLDYLNMITGSFVTLFGRTQIVLIHTDSIAGVTEMPDPH